MDGNLLKEISYLTRLIEQHKRGNGAYNSYNYEEKEAEVEEKDKKSSYPSIPNYAMEKQTSVSNKIYVKPHLQQGRKVHLNPNFKPKVMAIHVNPRMGTKSSVHVNPKMMKNFSAVQNPGEQQTDFDMLKKNIVERKIEPSVHVNPKLMKELSSAKEKSKNLDKFISNDKSTDPKPSKTKIVKINPSPNSGQKKTGNSNLVSLSKRKLVRIRRSSKTGGSLISPGSLGKVRRSSNSNMRKTKVSTKYKLVMERVDPPGTIASAASKSLNKNRQIGLNKYKIDRTHIQKVKRRLSIGKNNSNSIDKKNSPSTTTGLVTIGGILYKSSRNQLIRSSNDQQRLKKKRCVINVKGDRFVMASNGKKLRRLNTAGNGSGSIKPSSLVSRVDIGGMTFVEKTPNVLVRANTRNNISTKAKQRSIQILRNKMRKNNQPCLIFQRFGYCTNQAKGTCPKLHDKKQVALCKNFLQGKCLLDNCQMSHSVCPEKMPTCKYFLEGCCIRDNCPYLHVKVSSNTPICAQFLRGYCAEANKCKQRHVYVCPEYERSGNCAKGKYCPYPHRQSSSEYKKSNKIIIERKKSINKKKKIIMKPEIVSGVSHSEDRKRYYDEAGGSKEDFDKKRKTILNSIEIMKNVRSAEIHGENRESRDTNEDNGTAVVLQSCQNDDRSDKEQDSCPKRTPLGPLPAYIPID